MTGEQLERSGNSIRDMYEEMAESDRFAYMVGVDHVLANLHDRDLVESLRETLIERKLM